MALEVADLERQKDWFELGMNSIKAVKVVSILREAGLDVVVEDLYRFTTIIELSEELTAREPIQNVVQQEPPVEKFSLISAEDLEKLLKD